MLSFKIYSSILSILTVISLGNSEFLCPDADVVAPCVCNKDTESVSCTGVNIQQEHVDNVLVRVHEFQNDSQINPLTLNKFVLTRTNLTILNMVKIVRMQVKEFILDENSYLVIFNSSLNDGSHSIQVETLSMSFGILEDNHVNKLLDYIVYRGLINLDLYNNKLSFVGFDLTKFTDLANVNLRGNHIMALGTSKFRELRYLTHLDLSDNRMVQMSENALSVIQDVYDMIDVELMVNLSNNRLSDETLSTLGPFNRPTTLDLSHNNFVRLSMEKFSTFLFSNFKNRILIQNNYLVCASWFQWIQDARMVLEDRVMGVDCIDDDGTNVFNSDLHSLSFQTIAQFWLVMTFVTLVYANNLWN